MFLILEQMLQIYKDATVLLIERKYLIMIHPGVNLNMIVFLSCWLKIHLSILQMKVLFCFNLTFLILHSFFRYQLSCHMAIFYAYLYLLRLLNIRKEVDLKIKDDREDILFENWEAQIHQLGGCIRVEHVCVRHVLV